MRKLRTGDEVIVIAGRDKGKRGKITKVVQDEQKGLRIQVQGVNVVKKHQKPNPNLNVQGGIVEMEALLAFSNVAIFNPETGKGDRIGFQILEDGTKVRIFKSTKKQLGA